jgi:putative transposase
LSARSERDREIEQVLVEIFEESDQTYGTPRLHRELAGRGIHVSRRRVRRLTKGAGLVPRLSRIYRSNPRLHALYKGRNLQRDVEVTELNKVWVGDVTYLRVKKEWRYLSAVLDRLSRRTVGLSLKPDRNVDLTRTAWRNAVRARRPGPGLIFHSDRGTEYVGAQSRAYMKKLGIRQSVTERSLGDNQFAESFFHTLKADVIHGRHFESDAELRATVASYMRRYNHRRRHSALDCAPAEFERRLTEQCLRN